MAHAAHLVRRFFGALAPVGPNAADVAWVGSVLNPAELAVWQRLPRHDRRHSVRVAREVERTLARGPFADDPRWIEAALLHDIGKLDAGLGVVGRVGATLAAAAAGPELADAWAAKRGITRKVGLYLLHPQLGAERIRMCGGSHEAARWAECHQERARHPASGLPPEVVAALAAADDD